MNDIIPKLLEVKCVNSIILLSVLMSASFKYLPK